MGETTREETAKAKEAAEAELKESIRLNTFRIYSLQEMQAQLQKEMRRAIENGADEKTISEIQSEWDRNIQDYKQTTKRLKQDIDRMGKSGRETAQKAARETNPFSAFRGHDVGQYLEARLRALRAAIGKAIKDLRAKNEQREAEQEQAFNDTASTIKAKAKEFNAGIKGTMATTAAAYYSILAKMEKTFAKHLDQRIEELKKQQQEWEQKKAEAQKEADEKDPVDLDKDPSETAAKKDKKEKETTKAESESKSEKESSQEKKEQKSESKSEQKSSQEKDEQKPKSESEITDKTKPLKAEPVPDPKKTENSKIPRAEPEPDPKKAENPKIPRAEPEFATEKTEKTQTQPSPKKEQKQEKKAKSAQARKEPEQPKQEQPQPTPEPQSGQPQPEQKDSGLPLDGSDDDRPKNLENLTEREPDHEVGDDNAASTYSSDFDYLSHKYAETAPSQDAADSAKTEQLTEEELRKLKETMMMNGIKDTAEKNSSEYTGKAEDSTKAARDAAREAEEAKRAAERAAEQAKVDKLHGLSIDEAEKQILASLREQAELGEGKDVLFVDFDRDGDGKADTRFCVVPNGYEPCDYDKLLQDLQERKANGELTAGVDVEDKRYVNNISKDEPIDLAIEKATRRAEDARANKEKAATDPDIQDDKNYSYYVSVEDLHMGDDGKVHGGSRNVQYGDEGFAHQAASQEEVRGALFQKLKEYIDLLSKEGKMFVEKDKLWQEQHPILATARTGAVKGVKKGFQKGVSAIAQAAEQGAR